jgi:glutamine phosphoribosylpyrophosphate amidotransferase
MCGVIGVSLKSVSESDISLVQRIFLESQIRGKHATGVSFLKDGAIHTIKDSIPADEFVKKYNFHEFVDNGSLNLIGHCRYSTSDLLYNQPLATENKSIVHNGVISQELPENWEKLYGVKCETKNDSELLLHTDGDILKTWKDASISVIVLNKDGVFATRNGKRPLYKSTMTNGFIYTSTGDIARRAGIDESHRVPFEGKDLQP